MAQYILVTGNKYDRNVGLVLGALALLVVFGLIVITGWRPDVFRVAEKETPITEIAELSTELLDRSNFSMPYLVNVMRSDGSYSYAKIENGVVRSGRLIGLVELAYQNGDTGLVKESGGKIDIFISKTGTRESVSLVERAVTGIFLPDGSIYPVKVVNGKISRGMLSGDFEMASLLENKRILGKFDTRGNLVRVEVGQLLKEPDAVASLIGRELLKLSLEMTAGKTGAVLAATTDAPVDGAPVLNQSTGVSFYQVRKDSAEGSISVLPQTGPGVTAAVTVPIPITGDVSINPVTGLTVIGGGAVSGPKIAAGAVSETQLANDAVVESRIKDSAVTEGKIKDGAVTNVKLGTISDANKVSGSAVQLSSTGGLTNNSGLSLITTCAADEVLKWNGSSWACAAMSGGVSGVASLNLAAGDLTIGGGGINTVSVLGSAITVTGTVPSLDPTYFTTANISQWANNMGYITDGNTNWDNSYGFIVDGNTNWDNLYGFITDGNTGWDNIYDLITSTGSAVLTNKTIAAGSNTISGLTNSNLSGSAGITDANLATITASSKVSGSAVQLSSNGGIANSTGLSLLTSCSSGELLKWSGTAWVCSADASGGSSSLNTITAASGGNTINNGDNAQVWNWALTAAAKTAFTFGENTASTNGVGAQYLLSVGTLAASTANPIKISARGNTIIDTTSTGGLTFGNTTANTAITLQSGTGSINIGTEAVAKSVNIATGAAAQTVTLGSSNTTSTTTINAGSGGLIAAGAAAQTNGNYVLCVSTTTKKLYLGAARNNCDTSSIRFKHDVADVSIGLDAIKSLRPVSYVYNENGLSNLGFIAEEVALIDERLVNRDSQGLPYSLNTDTFIPILTKGIQQLDTKMESQGLSFYNQISSLSGEVKNISESLSPLSSDSQSNILSDIDILDVISKRINEIFNNTMEFFGKVIFRGEVKFVGRPVFNKDTAGLAVIKAGGSEVEILFEKEYSDEPVVTATVQVTGGAGVAEIPSYAIADVNTKGFKIRMSREIGMDIRFAWVALAVTDKTRFEGSGRVEATPAPTITPLPESTTVVTPSPEPAPVVEITPPDTASESGREEVIFQ